MSISYVFTDSQNRVTLKHNKPEKLSDVQKEQGYEVNREDIPDKPETDKGEKAVLYYTEEGGFWYKTIERELTEAERLEEVEEGIDLLLELELEKEGLIE